MAVEEVLNSFANCETLIFLRSVLRSEENLLQNCAILRNALRKQNEELPSGSNALTLCLYRQEPSADFSLKIRKRIAQPDEKRRKKTYEAVPGSRCF